ncbi:MAG: DUF420 domain-containing protein [Nitrospinae bacterium]|nr:DUF420 domain-containing protein [Nitrospinota bacterium]
MTFDVQILPHFQAWCNGTAAVLMVFGYYSIRKKNKRAHAAFMLSALFASTLFLIAYLAFHYLAGSVRYGGTGGVRTVYFFLLTSHTVLATATLPMIFYVLSRVVKRDFEAHKKAARWTLPAWLYVSITGVAVHIMLYHLR